MTAGRDKNIYYVSTRLQNMYITNNGKATIEIKATGDFLEEIKKELDEEK